MKSKIRFGQFVFLVLLLAATAARAQTSAFTYQGRLTDNTAAANGSYDFQFSLFDAGGAQIGASATVSGVAVTNGIFTVQLDFGVNAFPGAPRFLQIAVKKPDETVFTTLSPRQPVTSAPYAVKSLNAESAVNSTQLGGFAANQFVQTDDSRLTDERSPAAGSNNYIQNTLSPQSPANFNIGGTGRANVFNAVTQYNINGSRAFAITNPDNTFVGLNTGTLTTNGANSFFGSAAGAANAAGGFNSFFGASAGAGNTAGSNNSFYGVQAGESNTTGAENSFFGRFAGFSNSTDGQNSFFGALSGFSNTAAGNSFFGYRSGYANTTTAGNSFFGFQAGESNISANGSFFGYRAGRNNQRAGSTFFGYQAGMSNTTGFRNAFFGENAGRETTNGSFNSFFGSLAGESNTGGNNSFFGAIAGAGNTTGGDNSFFGRAAGSGNTEGSQNAFFGSGAGAENTTGSANSFFGYFAGSSNQTGLGNAFFGANAGLRNTSSSNTFLGSAAGNESVGNRNTLVGNTAGSNLISGNNNTFVGVVTGNLLSDISGNDNTLVGAFASISNNLSFATAIGAGASVSRNNAIALGRSTGSDTVIIYGLGAAGSTSLCRNANNEIATCSSSLRYKTGINNFTSGLNLVKRLQPITFDWKDGGMKDLGLGAEDVAAIEPLLATYNKNGEVEGVKYDRLGVVLLNAVREQQAQIETQEKENQELKRQIERQQKEIEEQKLTLEGLRVMVCARNPQAQAAALCRAQEEEKRDEK